MNENDDLDILVKIEFQKLYSELSSEKLKLINPNSINNIIYHLIENPRLNPKKNNKLQELGEIRMKRKLLDFFETAKNTDLDNYNAADLFKTYINPICTFMSDYYGFSGDGGKIIIMSILVVSIFGTGLDLILYSLNWINLPTFSISFLIIFIIRWILKFKQKKLYGLFY